MSRTSLESEKLPIEHPFKETLVIFGQRLLVFVAVVGVGLLPIALIGLLRGTAVAMPVMVSLLIVLGLPVVIWFIVQTTHIAGSYSIKTMRSRELYEDTMLQRLLVKRFEELKDEVETSLSNYEAHSRQTDVYVKVVIEDVYSGMGELLQLLGQKGVLPTEDRDIRESMLLLQYRPFLRHPDPKERWRAYANLIGLGTPKAMKSIREVLRTETDSKIIALARESGLVDT